MLRRGRRCGLGFITTTEPHNCCSSSVPKRPRAAAPGTLACTQAFPGPALPAMQACCSTSSSPTGRSLSCSFRCCATSRCGWPTPLAACTGLRAQQQQLATCCQDRRLPTHLRVSLRAPLSRAAAARRQGQPHSRHSGRSSRHRSAAAAFRGPKPGSCSSCGRCCCASSTARRTARACSLRRCMLPRQRRRLGPVASSFGR